jgi:uncharacterized protein
VKASPAAQLLRRIAPTLDGWFNTLTGLGDRSHDPTQHTEFDPEFLFTPFELALLYHNDDIVRRLVGIFPQEAMRRGLEIKGPESQFLTSEFERLDAARRVQEGATWGRQYGGGIGVMYVDDGLPAWEPLDLNAGPYKIGWIDVFDRRDVWRDQRFSDPNHPDYAHSKIFRVTPPYGGMFYVHRDRVLHFGGVLTGRREREIAGGWDHSVLQTLRPVIRDVANGYLALGNMLSDASQSVFTMKGLLGMIASSDGQQILGSRAQLLDLTRSVARSIFLDADQGEKFEKIATQFAGVPDVIDRFAQRLALSEGIPVTVLLGTSPAGMNATGESDIRNWYDKVESWRRTEITPHFMQLLRILCGPKHSNTIDYPPLWQPTPKEESETRLNQSKIDTAYIDREVVMPEEVAEARCGPEGWKTDVSVDMSIRRRSAPLPPATPAVETPAKSKVGGGSSFG